MSWVQQICYSEPFFFSLIPGGVHLEELKFCLLTVFGCIFKTSNRKHLQPMVGYNYNQILRFLFFAIFGNTTVSTASV